MGSSREWAIVGPARSQLFKRLVARLRTSRFTQRHLRKNMPDKALTSVQQSPKAQDERILKRFLLAQDSLVYQTADLSLGSLAGMMSPGARGKAAINLDPDFQRRERWAAEKQSALIESFLLNVPVPPIYLAEDEYGQYSVVDGKQRLSAIRAFMTGSLKLRELEKFKELEGRTFDHLPEPLQNALNIRPYVRVVTLLKQSDPALKFEVFTRLNRGGEPMLPTRTSEGCVSRHAKRSRL